MLKRIAYSRKEVVDGTLNEVRWLYHDLRDRRGGALDPNCLHLNQDLDLNQTNDLLFKTHMFSELSTNQIRNKSKKKATGFYQLGRPTINNQ